MKNGTITLSVMTCLSLYSPMQSMQQRVPKALISQVRDRHILNLLNYEQTSSPIREEEFDYLNHVPGFSSTLDKCTHLHGHGHAYEIKIALYFARRYPERKPVLGLNQKKQCPKTNIRREFDLILGTEERQLWIECKASNWQTKKYRQQFLEQQQIARNSRTDRLMITYAIMSQRPIPPGWKTWFRNHEILAYEKDVML